MAASILNTEGLAIASSLIGDREEIKIVIKFSGNQSFLIDIGLKDTINDLKEIVAKEANISARGINLVLGGQLLGDHALLEDFGLGANSTLHAFCWSDDGLTSEDLSGKFPFGGEGAKCVNELCGHGSRQSDVSVGKLSPETQHATEDVGSDVDGPDFFKTREETLDNAELYRKTGKQNEHYRFFVFCKICECIRPAKLRLRCIECGSGAFLVERGPSNWDDISPNTTIEGTCITHNCTCRTPSFYLRCSQSHGDEVEGTAVLLKHVQSNRRRIACITCEDIMSPVLIFPCSPGHVICLECFRQYGSICLRERRFVEHSVHGYTLPCPAGCTDSHIEESHHFLLLGPEQYEHYKVFGAEEYVLQNGGILCPAPGCGMGLFPEGNERLIKCRECQFESCRHCRRAYHIGACEDNVDALRQTLSNLAVNDERALRASWETQSLSLIGETTKPCPGCQAKTERSGGCTHMICSRCYQEWCWICVTPWSRKCQADHWFE